MIRGLLLLGLLLGALGARADELYRWKDETGAWNYTDDLQSVPEKFRARAQQTQGAELGVVSGDRPRATRSAEGTGEPGDEGGPARAAAAAKAKAAKAAEYEQRWRQQFRDAHERIADLLESLTADRRAVSDPSGAGLEARRDSVHGGQPTPEYEALRERVRHAEVELARARADLEALERRAANEAVPLEWRR